MDADDAVRFIDAADAGVVEFQCACQCAGFFVADGRCGRRNLTKNIICSLAESRIQQTWS